MGYTKNTIKGVSWTSGGRFITRSLAFLKILILARVLTPSQFGIFGIASLLLSFLETLTETGINVVLIQSKDALSDYINSAWVVSIIRGVIVAALLALSAPLIASFFHIEGATQLLLFTSLVPLVRGFINPAEVKFQKELRFQLQFWFTSALYIVDAVSAITIALITHSVYALIWGLLLSAIFEVIISFLLIRPLPKFSIEKKYFKDIFHRGIWITGYTVFNYIAENADNAVVGRVLGAEALGLYQMAYKVAILPITEVSDVVSSVVFPVYTKISGESKRLKKAFFKTVSTVALGSIVLGAVIFFFPTQLIMLFLGSKWLSIAPVLQVLIIYGVLRTIAGPASALFLSLGKQKYVTAMVFTRFFALAIAIYPLVLAKGLIGAAYAQVIAVAVEAPVLCFFVYKCFKKDE